MWKAVKWLDAFGVEVRGIERVGEHERTHTQIADCGWLWLSANTTISASNSPFETVSIESLKTDFFSHLLL